MSETDLNMQGRYGPSRLGYLIALLALTLFTACSGSGDEPQPTPQPTPQPLPQEGTAVSFSGGLQEEKAVTRAGERGLEELLDNKTFQVWGYKNDDYTAPNYTSYQAVMPNFTVNWAANTAYTTTSNTNDWEYVGQGSTPEQRAEQTIKYWDFGALAYRFFGYALGKDTPADPLTSAPAVTHASVAVGSGSNPSAVTFTSSVSAASEAGIDAAPYFTRLWFSTNGVGEPEYGKPVVLQFLKPFARVRFMFTFVEGLNFGREKLGHIAFGPSENLDNGDANDVKINTVGTVTVSYPLTGSSTAEDWTVAADPVHAGIKLFDIDYYEAPDPIPDGYPANTDPTSWPNTPGKWYYVLPTSTQGSFTAQVSVVSEEIKSVVIPAEYMQWKAGYEYTYKFKITETGGITIDIVQVAINDWGNRQSSDHTVYNW